MTGKRFIKGYHTIRDTEENKTYDFQVNIICDLLNEQHEENQRLQKENNILHKNIEKLDKLYEENQLLKQALRESLEQYGNDYSIEVLDELFDLQYDDWRKKRNDTETYDYVDWEEILEQKEMME